MRYIHRRFIEIIAGWALCFGIAHAQNQAADEPFPLKLDGDIGLGVYYTRSIIRDRRESALVLPYTYFDYGRLFARIDTFGVKTLKIGYGYLEFAGRVEFDGFKTDTPGLQGLHGRKNSLPLGIGTLQETPVGALFLNAFHDVNKSSGNLFDVTYIGRFTTQSITVYPQAGVEYLSKRYVDYYYGVSTQEASSGRHGRYQPGGALNPFVAVMMEIKITADWNLNLFARHKWLAASIHDSPLVGQKGMDTVFASLAYRFK
jgi:outer membrane protein